MILLNFVVIQQVRILGRDLGLPTELVDRHPFPGPGLAIRVICAQEPYMENDFAETQVLIRLLVEYSSMLQKVIQNYGNILGHI